MGALDEEHFNGELENGQGTAVIEDAVKVLLQGLGEDASREGLKKTLLRVLKALREGTRGCQSFPSFHSLILGPYKKRFNFYCSWIY
uniref:Uncharacterized protein n=1 Tax=Nelumbo nucifera TaxID=4432 RepID=A0A822Z284_NELNU|nr:TPA_asm: hypothetical protein HUJ06_007747 [Nelumbo nucifera]